MAMMTTTTTTTTTRGQLDSLENVRSAQKLEDAVGDILRGIAASAVPQDDVASFPSDGPAKDPAASTAPAASAVLGHVRRWLRSELERLTALDPEWRTPAAASPRSPPGDSSTAHLPRTGGTGGGDPVPAGQPGGAAGGTSQGANDGESGGGEGGQGRVRGQWSGHAGQGQAAAATAAAESLAGALGLSLPGSLLGWLSHSASHPLPPATGAPSGGDPAPAAAAARTAARSAGSSTSEWLNGGADPGVAVPLGGEAAADRVDPGSARGAGAAGRSADSRGAALGRRRLQQGAGGGRSSGGGAGGGDGASAGGASGSRSGGGGSGGGSGGAGGVQGGSSTWVETSGIQGFDWRDVRPLRVGALRAGWASYGWVALR
jgi:hypothetical protein